MDIVKRAELIAELKLAHEEGARLSEMIALLQTGHAFDESKLRQLRLERVVANKRALRLHEELRELEGANKGSDDIAVA